eukprot:COSAG01_NODE_31966_length_588_cov_1.789366_1_plen_82_part_10
MRRARLLDRGTVLYLVSNALDSWANPLGTWASYQAAPRYTSSPTTADDATPLTSHPNLRLLTFPDGNHCGFGESFELGDFSA